MEFLISQQLLSLNSIGFILSFLGSRVDITTLLLEKVLEAFSITPLSDSDTVSCCVLSLL